jgi:hypothetical protein
LDTDDEVAGGDDNDFNPTNTEEVAGTSPRTQAVSGAMLTKITDSNLRQSQRIRQNDVVQVQIGKWMKVRQLKSKVRSSYLKID